MYFPDPLYHQIIFGLLLITVTSRIAYLISSNPLLSPKPLVRSSPHSLSSPSSPSQLPSTTIASNSPREDDHIGSIYKTRITRLYSSGAITFVAGFVAWNLDNETCHLTEGWKASMGQPWSVVLEGHAWWHLVRFPSLLLYPLC
jgi:dihydroceramidase